MQLNGVAVQAGKWLGLAEGEAVAGGETFDDAARAVLETLLSEPRGVLTLLTGAEAPALDGTDRARARVASGARARRPRRRPAALSAPGGGRVTPVRVAIVEDNDVFRETLELVFGMRDEVVVVGSASSGDDAPELARRVTPDVVLMDYRMPGLNGAEATGAVLAAAPETKVICLTASVTSEEVDEVLAAGAIACMTKDGDFDLLVRKVCEAAAS